MRLVAISVGVGGKRCTMFVPGTVTREVNQFGRTVEKTRVSHDTYNNGVKRLFEQGEQRKMVLIK